MKIVKHIPNTITSLNLVFGSLGVIASFGGQLDCAFYCMLAAVVCDFFDGFVARMLHANSAIGKELDSLADVVSFGVLPAIMLHCLIAGTGHAILSYVPLVLPVFGALRLAKFNIDDEQSENFLGLPTPAMALIVGSFVHYLVKTESSIMWPWVESPVFVIASVLVLAFLMVSRIPMFSFKFKKGKKADTPIQRMRIAITGVFVCCCGLIALLGLNWSLVGLLTFVIYIFINIVAALTAPRG